MQGMKDARLPFALLLFVVTACGYPRPADVGDDGGPGDAPDPGVTIHVSPSGDDASDGLRSPVKTLKHAIGLAAADTKVTLIVLASGVYSAASGETFPFTVPAHVTIEGPAGGGAILSGGKMGPGMTVGVGGLRDLDLQDFTTATTVVGTASLKNIRVVTSAIAVQAETGARLTIEGLDITGTAAACSTGIVLNGHASLTASNVTTRALGTSLLARDQSTVVLTGANAAGDPSCVPPMFSFVSNGAVDMRDSLLDGGRDGIGIGSSDSSDPTQATLTGVIVRNIKVEALGGRNATVQVIGGKLSHTQQTSLSIIGGIWSLTNLTIENSNAAIYSQDARLMMRGCSIVDNSVGVDLGLGAIGDLGTIDNLGNNVFKNISLGLVIEGGNGTQLIQAVGNTWKAAQGADQNGKYGIGTVMNGPIPFASGNNFDIQSDASIQL
jgi:hypothetical protein